MFTRLLNGLRQNVYVSTAIHTAHRNITNAQQNQASCAAPPGRVLQTRKLEVAVALPTVDRTAGGNMQWHAGSKVLATRYRSKWPALLGNNQCSHSATSAITGGKMLPCGGHRDSSARSLWLRCRDSSARSLQRLDCAQSTLCCRTVAPLEKRL